MARRRRPPRAGALTELPPLRIAAQIAALQALYYAIAMGLMLFTALVSGTGFSLGLVLGWDVVRGDTSHGWLMAFVWLLDGGLCMSVAIIVLIARSKLVPDFALTVHFLHLVVTSLYTGRVPRHALWWTTMLASAGVCIAVSIWGCRYRELQPVFFGGGGGGGGGASSSNASRGRAPTGQPVDLEEGEATHAGDEESGYSRGRGRGRGRDGAGEYEMVQMESAR